MAGAVGQHDGGKTALVSAESPLPTAMVVDAAPADDVAVDLAEVAASPRLLAREHDAVAAAGAGRQPWQPEDGDAGADADVSGVDANAADKCYSRPALGDDRDLMASAALVLLRQAAEELLLVGRWAALRCRLPIPCRACSRSSGGSCAGCSCRSARIVSDTWSTGRVSLRCGGACVPSGGACA